MKYSELKLIKTGMVPVFYGRPVECLIEEGGVVRLELLTKLSSACTCALM